MSGPRILALSSRCFRGMRRTRSGLTLIEMLISVTITLLLVFAIVQVFDLLGSTMTQARATIEMAGNLRNVANLLQRDLDNITCPVRPWLDPAAGLGYFEYIEGWKLGQTGPIRGSDALPAQVKLGINLDGSIPGITSAEYSVYGDLDDILMMTVRASGEPFRGRWDPDLDPTNGYQPIESEFAEVIWWPRFDGPIQGDNRPRKNTFVLHRRVLLIRPDIDLTAIPISSIEDVRNFFFANDISARVVLDPVSNTVIGLAANSLADLTTPQNRFAHYRHDFFPSPTENRWVFPIDPWYLLNLPYENHPLFRMRDYEDVVLSDIFAFDVRAYDPEAPLRAAGNVALSPGDRGYDLQLPVIGQGAFVDLGFGGTIGHFARTGDPPIQGLTQNSVPRDGEFVHYDTWSLGFERDGIDQDLDGIIDQGFDGIDTPTTDPLNTQAPHLPRGGIDDYYERETQPPYNVPLLGIEVRIRMMEYATRQVRQVSVIGDFSDQ